MKLKSLLLIGAVAFAGAANAQAWIPDTVEMGAGYVNDVFYALKDGAKKSEPSNNWHLAFQIYKFGESDFSASVRANHINGKVEVYSMHMKASGGSFAAAGPSDTIGKAGFSMQLINDTTNWGEGAFTRNRNTGDVFDYGWGYYAGPPSHSVVGDSLYLVKVNGVAYKLWIQEYVSTTSMGGKIGYTFEIGKLDNSSPSNTVNILRSPNYEDRLFAYYDIINNQIVDREPGRKAWDILFTRYPKAVISGGGPGLQAYTGVVTNLDVSVADVRVAGAENLQWNSSQLQYDTTSLITIGDDWKKFDQPNMAYIVYDTINYFVKTADLAYYQMRFKGFEFQGPDAGRIIFEKRFLAALDVEDVTKNEVAAFAMVPNPASSNVNIMMDAKESGRAQLAVTDIAGRVVANNSMALNKGINSIAINTSSFANGIYMVTVTNGNWKIAEKLVVQH